MRRQLAVKGAGPRRSLHRRRLTLAMRDFGASPGVRRALQIIFALVSQAPVPEMVGGGRAGRDVLVESQKPERPTHSGGARAVPRPIEPVEEAPREDVLDLEQRSVIAGRELSLHPAFVPIHLPSY